MLLIKFKFLMYVVQVFSHLKKHFLTKAIDCFVNKV